jgi:hypothetical protein
MWFKHQMATPAQILRSLAQVERHRAEGFSLIPTVRKLWVSRVSL